MSDPRAMIALVLAMILCLVLGLAVVGIVAIPARREGRELLTPQGEEVVSKVLKRTESVASVTREKTGDLLSTGRDKTGDLVSSTKQKVADATTRGQTDAGPRETS